MRSSRIALLFGFGTAAFALAAAAEDLTITYKVTGRGDAAATTTQYYSATKVRTSDGQRETVLDLAAGKILTIDSQKKEYSEIDLAELEAMMKQATAQMDEAMKNVPPGMREQMAKMMGGGAAPGGAALNVTKGGTRKVAGYACQEYTIAMGENFKNETCNTTALPLPFDPAQFRKLWAMSNPTFMRDAAKFAEQLQKVEGLPLAENTSVSMMGRSMTSSKEATEVKKGPIAASVFEPPAGYKKVDSPLKAMSGGKPGRRD